MLCVDEFRGWGLGLRVYSFGVAIFEVERWWRSGLWGIRSEGVGRFGWKFLQIIPEESLRRIPPPKRWAVRGQALRDPRVGESTTTSFETVVHTKSLANTA